MDLDVGRAVSCGSELLRALCVIALGRVDWEMRSCSHKRGSAREEGTTMSKFSNHWAAIISHQSVTTCGASQHLGIYGSVINHCVYIYQTICKSRDSSHYREGFYTQLD